MYIKLFLAFFKVGLFSFGGGLASLHLIQVEIVDKYKWLDLAVFTDLISIAQMTPGPIAINAATFVGLKTGGITGALVATFACILPSVIIVFFLLMMYNRYRELDVVQSILKSLRPAIVALIAVAGIKIAQLVIFVDGIPGLNNLDMVGIGTFIASFVALLKYKMAPVKVMLIFGAVGAVGYYMLT